MTEPIQKLWTRYRSGAAWRVLDDGRIVCRDLPQVGAPVDPRPLAGVGYLYRTRGEPLSMRQLLVDFEHELLEASSQCGVPMHWLCGLIAIEATRLKADRLRFDPRCVREEPGYRSDATTPHRVSPGLMQALLSTAADMLPRCPWLRHEGPLSREDLFVPRYSISLGAAYVRHQMDRIEDDERDLPRHDPVLNACAAYNAGSVRFDGTNAWHLLTYGHDRVDRFIAYTNDAHEVLELTGRSRRGRDVS